MLRGQSKATPPTPTYDRIEEELELDQIFFGEAPYEPDADTEAAARGGAHRSRPGAYCRKIWQLVCGILDQGIDAARERIAPMAVIDFPFCDNHGAYCRPSCSLLPEEEHLHVAKEEGLLERGWVFAVEGEGINHDTRLMIHGHTFLEWHKRGETEVKKRADNLTSVNWRIAEKDARNEWRQDTRGNPVLPLNRGINWRNFYREKRFDPVTFRWREWGGGGEGFPSADLASGRNEPTAADARTYKRVQTLLRLADEAELQEMLSKRQTDKAIRSHGQFVSEIDITSLTRRPLRDLVPASMLMRDKREREREEEDREREHKIAQWLEVPATEQARLTAESSGAQDVV